MYDRSRLNCRPIIITGCYWLPLCRLNKLPLLSSSHLAQRDKLAEDPNNIRTPQHNRLLIKEMRTWRVLAAALCCSAVPTQYVCNCFCNLKCLRKPRSPMKAFVTSDAPGCGVTRRFVVLSGSRKASSQSRHYTLGSTTPFCSWQPGTSLTHRLNSAKWVSGSDIGYRSLLCKQPASQIHPW